MNQTIVSIDWLFQHIGDPNLVILDASLKQNQANLKTNFSNLKIKGARFFDLKNIFSCQDSDLPNMVLSPQYFALECQKLGINQDSTIVVYDNLGIYSSPRVWWMFQLMGHTNIAVLDGGLPAWVSALYPTEIYSADSTTYKLGNFITNYNAGWLVNQSQLTQHLSDTTAIIIDARKEARFWGKAPEPRPNLRSGHIQGSINIPFTKVLHSGFFKEKEALLTLAQSLNLGKKRLIFSCGSGTTACILLLALQTVLKNPMALYDGSWSEWGIKN